MRYNVSMPSTGFYLFLLKENRKYIFLQLCQCPQRASTYFFRNSMMQTLILSKCVNALNGLLLISSVPSQNP